MEDSKTCSLSWGAPRDASTALRVHKVAGAGGLDRILSDMEGRLPRCFDVWLSFSMMLGLTSGAAQLRSQSLPMSLSSSMAWVCAGTICPD